MHLLTRPACIPAVLALLAIFSVAPAVAQTPDRGSLAAGADIGVLFPDDAFENTFTADAFGEYYVTPQVSLRGLFGYASPGVDNRTEDHFRQVKLLFNGVYHWQLNAWRPYATFGAGFYFVRVLLDDRDDPEGETRGGLNFGGGGEYSLNDQSAVKVELRWDVVSHPTGLPDATGLNFTVGYKRYF